LIVETFVGSQAVAVAEARYVVDANGQQCEFAVVVADDWQHLGLARRLLDKLLESATPAPRTAAAPTGPHGPAGPSTPPTTPDQPPVNRPRVPGQPLPPQPSGSEISAEALANLAEVAKKSKRLSLMQLTERTCKWPVGDPATEEFWFCGPPAAAGKPYCEAHVAVAFQPMSARRDRRAGGR
jgi:GcrA cell cycle regulator